MLEIRGLTKYYRNIPVVNDVSFAIRPGEVTGWRAAWQERSREPFPILTTWL